RCAFGADAAEIGGMQFVRLYRKIAPAVRLALQAAAHTAIRAGGTNAFAHGPSTPASISTRPRSRRTPIRGAQPLPWSEPIGSPVARSIFMPCSGQVT